jgi:hypothetical protein
MQRDSSCSDIPLAGEIDIEVSAENKHFYQHFDGESRLLFSLRRWLYFLIRLPG